MQLNINNILKILPQRYPFILVDRVIDLQQEYDNMFKNVSANEPHFLGHFPGNPIMPGVLIIEAFAQSTALLLCHDMEGLDKKVMYLAQVEKARFSKPVTPGDALILKIEKSAGSGKVIKTKCFGYVNDVQVASASILACIEDKS